MRLSSVAETTLHNQLKNWYAMPGDTIEAPVEGYLIDILRGDLLVEIQTRSFSSLRSKLETLLPQHAVRLVHPIAQEKWIVRQGKDKSKLSKRRKSPKHGRVEQVFKELVYIPHLVGKSNFSLEILLTREEEHWVDDGSGSWRRKGWRVAERYLLEVVERVELSSPKDYLRLLPEDLPDPFTTLDLAQQAGIPRRLAQQMAYSMRAIDMIQIADTKGRERFYTPLEG
jgi:hypothetical protein